jgi:hypothetical protein
MDWDQTTDSAAKAGPARARPEPATDALSRLKQLLGVPADAGNGAIATAISEVLVWGHPKQPGGPRSATMTLADWLAKSSPQDRFRVQIKTAESDIIGHAWITVAQVGDPSRSLSVGFWPGAAISGIYGPGRLHSPDDHDGEEDHAESAEVDVDHLRTLLNVVNEYESANYSLTANNCTDFARKAWEAATGREVSFDDAVVWSPAMLGMIIEQDNKSRGFDDMEHPKAVAK